jgi:hypothetical protein
LVAAQDFHWNIACRHQTGEHRPIKAVTKSLRELLAAASRLENLPYTILGGLMLLSLGARVLLILR